LVPAAADDDEEDDDDDDDGDSAGGGGATAVVIACRADVAGVEKGESELNIVAAFQFCDDPVLYTCDDRVALFGIGATLRGSR
jgi:hypothetical protein